MHIPAFTEERRLMGEGFSRVAGVDEAGCGALAGPVVAAAVILPLDSRIGRLRDSKLIPEREREGLCELVMERSAGWAVGYATVAEISEINIRQAGLLAMRRAVESLRDPDHAVVDAWEIPGLSIPQTAIVRADRTVKSVAAASVVAKVLRDRMMRRLDEVFPGYGFATHKGYGTRAHRAAIARLGPCPAHRLDYKTFQ